MNVLSFFIASVPSLATSVHGLGHKDTIFFNIEIEPAVHAHSPSNKKGGGLWALQEVSNECLYSVGGHLFGNICSSQTIEGVFQ